MDRDVLLQGLLYLKEARVLAQYRADVVVDHNNYVEDLDRHRFNPFLRSYLRKKIADTDYKIWDYDFRIKGYLESCEDVQRELPTELVLHLQWINCAIDDIVSGRAGCVTGLATLFELRRDARRDELDRRIEKKMDLTGL